MSPSKKRRIRIQHQKRGKRKGMKKGQNVGKDPFKEYGKQGHFLSLLKHMIGMKDRGKR